MPIPVVQDMSNKMESNNSTNDNNILIRLPNRDIINNNNISESEIHSNHHLKRTRSNENLSNINHSNHELDIDNDEQSYDSTDEETSTEPEEENTKNIQESQSMETDEKSSNSSSSSKKSEPVPFYKTNTTIDLFQMMTKMRQETSSNNTITNQKNNDESIMANIHLDAINGVDSPLQRTSSNASSTSTSSISTASSCLMSSLMNESANSLCSSTSNMSLLNENHLKALIMSAAASKSNINSNDSTNNSKPANEDAMAVAMAAFADQFAYMVRSRSSSLSESSNSSINTTNSSNLNFHHNPNQKMLDLAAKSIDSLINSQNHTNTVSENNNNNNNLLNFGLNSANLMKQMLNSYQNVLQNNNNNTSIKQPIINVNNQNKHSSLASQLSPQISNRKGSSSSSSSSSSSTSSIIITDQNNQMNAIVQPTSTSTLCNVQGSIRTSEEIKAKINEVANKSVINSISPTSTPCKVCGDEASGFHYGVDSCEGCKGFFRRCITQGMNHQCTNNQLCEMTPFSRNSCQFCRLKKCFAVGMSREASRLGRRPKRVKDEKYELDNSSANESYTPNTTPLKQINTFPNQQQKNESIINNDTASNSSLLKLANNEESLFSKSVKKESFNNLNKDKPNIQPPFKLENSTTPSLISTSDKINNSEESINKSNGISDFYNFKKLNINKCTSNGNTMDMGPKLVDFDSSNIIAKALNNCQSDPVPNYFDQNTTNKINNILITSAAQQQKETSQQQMQQIEMLTKLISISDRHTSIERTNELEFIRTTIIQSHLQIWPTTSEKKRERYVKRPPIRAPYSSLKSSDNPKQPTEVDWNKFVDAMTPIITDVVKFCRYIPGFNQILQPDQVQLLRQGAYEVICVFWFILVDTQNKLMLTHDLEFLMDQNTIKETPLGFFMSDVFELALHASQLKLSDAELALFGALLIMNPDRGDLQDKDHIEELQSTLLHVLYKHIKYYRADSNTDLFFKLLKLIPLVQEINRKHSEALNMISTNSNQKQQPSSSASASSSSTTSNYVMA